MYYLNFRTFVQITITLSKINSILHEVIDMLLYHYLYKTNPIPTDQSNLITQIICLPWNDFQSAGTGQGSCSFMVKLPTVSLRLGQVLLYCLRSAYPPAPEHLVRLISSAITMLHIWSRIHGDKLINFIEDRVLFMKCVSRRKNVGLQSVISPRQNKTSYFISRATILMRTFFLW